ncbi:hypothetical protein N665_0530s0046 [Sinapis alba]|nr:hypothetical protein N665_0530s0046 [Sinapis alba]
MLLILGTPSGFTRRPHLAPNLLPCPTASVPPMKHFPVKGFSLAHSLVIPFLSSLLPQPPDLRLSELLVSSQLTEPPDPPVVRGEEETPVPPDPPDVLVDSFPSFIPFPSLTVALGLVSDRDLSLVSALNLRDPYVDLVPFVFFSDTSIALVRIITAVCRFLTEVSRFASGFFASFSSFPQSFKTCWFSKVEMVTIYVDAR